MTPRTREWLRKPESDRKIARKVFRLGPRSMVTPVSTRQQAVEKYLKGLLNERGQTVPRTHDLLDLVDLLLPSDQSLKALRSPAGRLTTYAVVFRYPGAPRTSGAP